MLHFSEVGVKWRSSFPRGRGVFQGVSQKCTGNLESTSALIVGDTAESDTREDKVKER